MLNVTIPSHDGLEFGGYLARPRQANGAGILVIQEIFGVNEGIRTIADHWAAAGYLALAPDLFWRQERAVSLSDQTKTEWDKAIALMNGFDTAVGLRDLQDGINFLRRAGCPKVGNIGFCLGGKLAYLLACHSDADASISYYGVGIETLLAEAAGRRGPLLMHIAAEDRFVPKAAQQQITAALSGQAGVTVHIYPGVDHAFARPQGQHFAAAAAALAEQRTTEFLRHWLLS